METASVPKISPKDLVTSLRQRAGTNPVFNAMCHVFAMRERTRQQITIQSLYLVMVREGFKFNKEQYAKELSFLSTLGIGRLESDKHGVSALKQIKVTLQSIGMAGLSKKDSVEKFNLTPSFVKLPLQTSDVPRQPVPLMQTKADLSEYKVAVTVERHGKALTFQIDQSGMSAEAFLELLSDLNSNKFGGK